MLRIEYFDKERFMRQLSASHGSVLLHLDNGKTCDLKQDATARSMLQMVPWSGGWLQLHGAMFPW